MEKELGSQLHGLVLTVDIHIMLQQKPSFIKLEMSYMKTNIMKNVQNAA